MVNPSPFSAPGRSTKKRKLYELCPQRLKYSSSWFRIGLSVVGALIFFGTYDVLDKDSLGLASYDYYTANYDSLLLSNRSLSVPKSSDSILTLSSQPCHFVIETGTFDFHQEFIESIIANWPVDAAVELPDRCRHHPFIFHVKQGANRPRNRDWRDFANQYMIDRVYHDELGRERRFGFVAATFKKFLPLNVTYQARILLSCYCAKEDIVQMVNTPNTYCYFHEACPVALDHPRAYWAHPSQPRVVFPTVQPEFQRPSLGVPPYEFCTVGSISRRDWSLMRDLVDNHPSVVNTKMTFQILGMGNLPAILINDTQAAVRQTDAFSYYEFEGALAKNCHVLMALVTKSTNPDYFDDSKMKVTAAMVHSAAYQIPIVVHEDLYPIYKKYLPLDATTHSDDPTTFTKAILDMIDKLEAQSNMSPTT